jgi:hypothetical protein
MLCGGITSIPAVQAFADKLLEECFPKGAQGPPCRQARALRVCTPSLEPTLATAPSGPALHLHRPRPHAGRRRPRPVCPCPALPTSGHMMDGMKRLLAKLPPDTMTKCRNVCYVSLAALDPRAAAAAPPGAGGGLFPVPAAPSEKDLRFVSVGDWRSAGDLADGAMASGYFPLVSDQGTYYTFRWALGHPAGPRTSAAAGGCMGG